MALRDSDGFGFSTTWSDFITYGAVVNVSLGQYCLINTSGGPLGDPYVSANSLSYVFGKKFPGGAVGSFTVGIRVNATNVAVGGGYFYPMVFYLAGAEQFHIEAIGGSLQVYRGATALGSASAAYPTSGWFYLECQSTIGTGTAGSVTVRVNGAAVLTLTGINNANAGGTTADMVGFTGGNGGGSNTAWYAHYYMTDTTGSAPANGFLGDVRVQTLFPTSNATVTFTPNGLTNNYQNAAKCPPVPATDYNASSTVGAQDTFNTAGPAAGTSNIYGLNVKVLALKDVSGNRSVETVIVSGGATATGTAAALSTTAQQVSGMQAVDPATSAQWTFAAAAAAKIGYTVSA